MADDLIGVEIGSYRLNSIIGSGGMGAVYLGVHPLIGKRVAVKVLHSEAAAIPDAVGRFFNEARAVALLRHPHIVELIDFGQVDLPGHGTVHYCVMELLEGETLRQRLERAGALPEPLAVHIVAQIAGALAVAHRHQIIHRDLKPENVFLTGPEHDQVKLLDFGIAKLHDQNAAAAVQTKAGTILGTPAYMSPEQCMARPVDPRTDVYSLGILLFEMCTGDVPFTGEGYADLLVRQVMNEPPAPRSLNPALSEQLERVVLRALVKDPAGRFQSMEELLAALGPSERPAAVQVRPTPAAAAAQTLLKAPVVAPVPPRKSVPPTPISASQPTIAGNFTSPLVAPGAPPPQRGGVGATSPPRRGPSPALLGGLLGGLVVGGGVLAYILLAPAPSPPSTTAPVGTVAIEGGPRPQMTRLRVVSVPAGAEVRRTDTHELLGQTPLDRELPSDGTLLPLAVHKEGYQDESRAVVLREREISLSFPLSPAAEDATDRPAPAPPDPAAPKKPRGGSHSSRKSSGSLGDDVLAPGQ